MAREETPKNNAQNALTHWQKSLAERKPVSSPHRNLTEAANPLHELVEAKITDDLKAKGLNGMSLRTLKFQWDDDNLNDVSVGVSGAEDQIKIARSYFRDVVTRHLGLCGSFWATTGPVPESDIYVKMQVHANNKDDLAKGAGHRPQAAFPEGDVKRDEGNPEQRKKDTTALAAIPRHAGARTGKRGRAASRIEVGSRE